MGVQEGRFFVSLGDKCRTNLHYARKVQFTIELQLKIPNITGKNFPTLGLKLGDRYKKVLSASQLSPPHQLPQF